VVRYSFFEDSICANIYFVKGVYAMYEFECLTTCEVVSVNAEDCSPFLGGCYPEAEGCCGPDCSPN